jgi:hypothetical protein
LSDKTRIRHNPRPSLAGCSQCPWGTKTNIQETIRKWYKLPSFIMTSSWKWRLHWERCIHFPLKLFPLHCDPQFAQSLFYRSRTFGRTFAFLTFEYQDQPCFLFSFPIGCKKYPGKVSDSCIFLSQFGLGLERIMGSSSKLGEDGKVM